MLVKEVLAKCWFYSIPNWMPFVDSELNSLGPFEKSDMAYIPEEDALVLSRYGIVDVLLGE